MNHLACLVKNKRDCSAGLCLIPVMILVLLMTLSTIALSDEPDSKPKENSVPNLETIDAKIKDLNEKIGTLAGVASEKPAGEFSPSDEMIREKTEALTRLHSAYHRLKNVLRGLEKARADQITIKKVNEDFRTKGMPQKGPYSLAFHDSIRVDLTTTAKARQSLEHTIEMLDTQINESKTRFVQKEAELRQLSEKQKNNADIAATPDGLLEKQILQILIEYHRINRLVFETEKEKHAVDIRNIELQTRLLQAKDQHVSSNIHYDEADLKHQLELIEKLKNETSAEIEKIRSDQIEVDLEWGRAQQRLSQAGDVLERETAQAYLNARNEWKKTYSVVLELKQETLLLLDRQQMVWKSRYDIVKGNLSHDRKKELLADSHVFMAGLKQTQQIQQNYINSLQNQISSVDRLIQDEKNAPAGKKHLYVERDALKRQFERRIEFQSLLLASDQLEQHLNFQLETVLNEISFIERFQLFFQLFQKIWKFEIWVVDQNSVYFGKIVTAVVILLVGIVFSRLVMRRMFKRLLETSQLKETTASAIYKAFSYAVYLMVFLFALRMVNIPLTAFAFLGGAVAIGIGFGAQNLINNFISGFIILGERPINIGDLIEVDGVLGKVEEIGARCTRVRTGENVHKLIPNSSFLEKNITNWTLSDNNIRTKIMVGAAYGSPVRKVEELLLKATASNPTVLKFPEPFVIFSDFGDNALIFEVYFWVTIRMVLEKRQIESQVRFEIDDLFREAGITIAFPQRDVHFDTDKPLQIRLQKDPG